MTLTNTFVEGAFKQIRTLLPDNVVVVNVGGDTGNGVLDSKRLDASLDGYGERGDAVRTVRVVASEIAEPEAGQSILVDGQKVTVTSTRIDPTGAVLVIDYRATSEAS